MSAASVSVLLPEPRTQGGEGAAAEIARYLASTGLDFEIVRLTACEGEGYGAMLRRGSSEARGDVIAVVDGELSHGVTAIGAAVAMIQGGGTDVVFGVTGRRRRSADALLRWLLVDILPDPLTSFKAFSAAAARLVIGESRLGGAAVGLEIAFLANKYGFRVEPLQVSAPAAATPAFTGAALIPAVRIRLTARNMGYRASRRCPVCFANDVWTAAQIPGNLVRACSRCQCRYLNEFPDGADAPARHFVPDALAVDAHPEFHSTTARERTSQRRLSFIRKHLAPRARVLEVGVRDASFGIAAASEYEYVGIDRSQVIARAARARGLEVYCGTLASFVNTGASFDAVALFHVFENLPDPHDALGRIKDLLKPGGVLFLTTFDTEGLLYSFTEKKHVARAFRTHLILYSRSAMIELLEHSGFEIEGIGPDFEHRDHRFLRHEIAGRWPLLSPAVNAILSLLPDPLLVGTGSIRIVARRRAGSPADMRAIRSPEATHAR